MKRLLGVAFVLLALVLPASFAQTKAKKFKDKRFEPVVKQDVREYSGRYVGIEPSYVLDIQVSDDGALTAVSYEDERRATLREIKLTGSRLTATKVYEDGATEKFEAQFVNRILNGVTAFGVIVENLRIELAGATLTRVFYQRASSSVAP